MYNTDIPSRAELPTSKQLLRSTVLAILAAAAILVTIVLPAEYAIDPTGIGRVLGLTEMGQIKTQLADEARRDRIRDQQPDATQSPDKRSDLMGTIISTFVIRSAAAQAAPAGRTDETSITLTPGQGMEIKLAMKRNAKTNYSWTVAGGVVNFDMHGDGGGTEKSYEKGRASPGAKGVLQAAFDGSHGWFWRNRGTSNVTVILKTQGEYSDIKKLN
ncbi:MAG: transmembrane anchor protein [Burkholderiales bacterium]|nr:transmembrane anchor protein [Phycisphaerae bacterium]